MCAVDAGAERVTRGLNGAKKFAHARVKGREARGGPIDTDCPVMCVA